MVRVQEQQALAAREHARERELVRLFLPRARLRRCVSTCGVAYVCVHSVQARLGRWDECGRRTDP